MIKKKTYRSIIVDDEKSQQDFLSGMLTNHFEHIEVVQICSNVSNGIKAIDELKPDLVFLDVMMPPETGFDLLDKINDINFEVIFVTSFEKYAVNAFRVSAVDYLLKPFTLKQLTEAILKFEEKALTKAGNESLRLLVHNLNTSVIEKTRIALPTHNGLLFCEIGEITHCISDNTYTTFYFTNKQQSVVCKPIGDCEEMLGALNFVRIHNRTLINLTYLKEYLRGEGGRVKLYNNTMLDVARHRKEDLLAAIKRM